MQHAGLYAGYSRYLLSCAAPPARVCGVLLCNCSGRNIASRSFTSALLTMYAFEPSKRNSGKTECSPAQERQRRRFPESRYLLSINYAMAVLLAPVTLWASAALFFDLPFQGARTPAAALYIFLVAGVLGWIRPVWKAV